MTVPVNPESDPTAGSPPEAGSVLLSAQRLQLDSEWVVNGVLRLRRELQTETRLIEVTVRREVLHIDYQHVSGVDPISGARLDVPAVPEPPADRAPVVIVLREEVPRVSVVAVPYETVTATFSRQSSQYEVQQVLAREDVVLETTPGTAVRNPGSDRSDPAS